MDIWNLHKHPKQIEHYERRLTIPNFAFKMLKGSSLSNSERTTAERTISNHSTYSYLYSLNVIHKRFPMGETIIGRFANYSYWYADKIIRGKFSQGEEAISKDSLYSWWYARNILKGRFELGEEVIMNSYFEDDYIELIKLSKSSLN